MVKAQKSFGDNFFFFADRYTPAFLRDKNGNNNDDQNNGIVDHENTEGFIIIEKDEDEYMEM